MKRAAITAGLVLLIAGSLALAQWASFPKGTIRVGDRAITVELARTPDEQSTGLMYRDRLATDEGMIFLYEHPRTFSFWMKNTRIKLSIAFVDAAGRIFQIEDMEPFSEDLIRSTGTGIAAIEMNRGWFADNDVAVGSRVDLSPLHDAGLWPPAGPTGPRR